MGSNLFRVIPLLGISSPCRGNIFFKYRERSRRRLILEANLEESRVVALVLLCTHVLELYKFDICCIRIIYYLLKLLYLVGIYLDEYWFMGQSGRFYSRICLLMLIGTGFVFR